MRILRRGFADLNIQIISSDPGVLKHVLVTDFDNFAKGEKFRERAEGFLGDGIFNSDGDR